jgi:serpin B
LGASGQARTETVGALLKALTRYEGDPAAVQAETLPAVPVVHTAQRVVVDDGVELAAAFLDRLQQGYGAGVLTADLGSQAGVDALSSWVKENTGGLVERSTVQPDPLLTAVLQDAVVVAAAWLDPFDPADTFDADFTVPGTGPVSVPTMHGTLSVPVVTGDGWQAVRLPYSNSLSADLMMSTGCCPPAVVCDCEVQPAEYDDPAQADPQILAGLSAQLDTAAETQIRLSLPTLDLTSTTDLMPLLGSLGLTGPLTGVRADAAPVEVMQAVQQAVLKVDEDGTRAAAVTEIITGITAALPQGDEIRFDHPFVLVVRDNDTGWPILIASVTDPR